jgi:hypothetical protein
MTTPRAAAFRQRDAERRAAAEATWSEPRVSHAPRIRFAYLLWWLLAIGLYVSLLYLSSNLVTDPPSTTQQRQLAALQIATVIAGTGFLPILFLHSFFRTEKGRARDAALAEAKANGWSISFRGEINEWYDQVFDPRRYPIPATLALVTFLAGWTFIFFHDGPLIDEMVVPGVGLRSLADQIATGPPLSYGFLGAYFFAVWLLFKRYMSGDLGPGAFLHVAIRTWLVAILTIVLAELLGQSAVRVTGSDMTEAAIAAAAFTGAFVPSAVLRRIQDLAKGVLSSDGESKEIALTVLGGMNPWKAARLAEEGIDNVQNLAMDQPSRLFVVTREGGFRILDWIDQAILYNAASETLRCKLLNLEIRTAFDLYLVLESREMVSDRLRQDGSRSYRVKSPDGEPFPGIDNGALLNVALAVFNHPTFENVRRMRTAALREASKPLAAETMEMDAKSARGVRVSMRPDLDPAVLLVKRPDGAMASAVAVGPDLAVTTLDVGDERLTFFAAAGSTASGKEQVEGSLVATTPQTHLCQYRLSDDRIVVPARIAPTDSEPGDTVIRQSHLSGEQHGSVVARVPSVRIVSGHGNLTLRDVLRVSIPAEQGDAGAPLFNAAGELAAVVVGGGDDHSLAVPVSNLRFEPATRRRKTITVGRGRAVEPAAGGPAVPAQPGS